MRRSPGIVALLVLAGCRVFDESLIEDAGSSSDAGARDAGAADVPTEPSDAGPGCDLARPPPRPPGEDDGVEGGELVYVFHHLILDQGDERWRAIGWDLDGICSDPPDPAVECHAVASSAIPEIDGDNGIDNALGHNLLGLITVAFPDIEMTLSGHEWGHGSLLIRIRGWNREDDDPRVDVTFTQTVVGTTPLEDGSAPEIDPADILNGVFPPRPSWDGNDYFWVRNGSFFEGDLERPRIRIDNAYVNDRVLVLHFPDRVPIIFNDQEGALVVQFTDGHLAGRIREDLSGFEWATFGGRWPVADLLATLPTAGFCLGSDDYRRIQRITDLTADVRTLPGTGGPGTVCDAISGGLVGQGTRGRIAGGLSTHDAIIDKCADAGTPADAGPDGDAGAASDGGA